MYEFKINNIDWEISLADYDDIEACGLTTYCEYKIQILKTLKPSQMKSTIIHELTHAFRWSYGNVSCMELLNFPSSEVEEYIANTVEVFGERIIKLANILTEKMIEEKENYVYVNE